MRAEIGMTIAIAIYLETKQKPEIKLMKQKRLPDHLRNYPRVNVSQLTEYSQIRFVNLIKKELGH